MSIHYNDTLANARLQKVIDATDAGGSNGLLVIGTSALSGATGVLVTLTLAAPSATIAARVLTLSLTPFSAFASAGGIAAKAEIRTSAGTVVASGLTVGDVGSGADIIVDTTAIVSGRQVFLLSGTITHP